ncbi:MAG: signal peptidase II [Actinomycetes bacterium]
MTDAATSDAPSSTAPAGASRRRSLIVLGCVAVGVVVLDQLSKHWVVSSILPRLQSGEGPIVLLGGLVKFTYTENTGAAFSMGTGMTWVFTLIAIGVAVVILRSSRRLGSVWWAVALGGLLGGAVGNLIDRLTREPGFGRGYVVDWIQLPHFAVFNLADSAIVCSAILMVALSVFGVEFDGRPRGASAASAGADVA